MQAQLLFISCLMKENEEYARANRSPCMFRRGQFLARGSRLRPFCARLYSRPHRKILVWPPKRRCIAIFMNKIRTIDPVVELFYSRRRKFRRTTTNFFQTGPKNTPNSAHLGNFEILSRLTGKKSKKFSHCFIVCISATGYPFGTANRSNLNGKLKILPTNRWKQDTEGRFCTCFDFQLLRFFSIFDF